MRKRYFPNIRKEEIRKLILKNSLLISTITLLFIPASSVFCQDADDEFPQYTYQFGGGYSFPLAGIKENALTDYLIQYRAKAAYFQPITSTWFLNERFGWEINYLYFTSNDLVGRKYDFYNGLEESFGTDYYIRAVPRNNDPEYDATDDYFSASFGLVYRIMYPSYSILPKILLGYTEISVDKYDVLLKERGSNQYLKLRYAAYPPASFLTLSGAVTFSRRIYRHIHLALDLRYTYFKPGIVYDVEEYNLYTNQTTREEINYKKGVHAISIGGGLLFDLKYSSMSY